MLLSPQLLAQRPGLVPDYERLLSLPEKVIQFGTGVLLRGLPDYFIHKANEQGIFNGRIVVVKSTGGTTSDFEQQQHIFSHSIRGIENGTETDEFIINTAISRTLTASENWSDILACARNPELNIVISNTTEVGIQLVEDDIFASPPASFPGKLTAYLLERFNALGGDAGTGMIIIPTELIVENGTRLREIVLEQASRHGLDASFRRWLEEDNYFCDSLVDRIVPGKPDLSVVAEILAKHDFEDELFIVSEVYRLWAIEGNDFVKSRLSFAQADSGVIVAPDIDLFRELKLRLLNGTHTLTSGYCFLKGFDLVSQTQADPEAAAFVRGLMLEELAPAIPYEVDPAQAQTFGEQVLDRFRNPFIRHQLVDITVQYTAKMKMRNIPTLLNHYRHSERVPQRFAEGFAAYLRFMKPVYHKNGAYYGERNGEPYSIRCDSAAYFDEKWKNAASPADLAAQVLGDVSVWGTDLTLLPGFLDAVQGYMLEGTGISPEEL
ncbi:tagaturonate reductase [Dyadobacter sandarakinus]|uniref:Tagaturonate reductase n=1 Tax=Dyadobacter sandarakinus TaxID=2747268 RepID=A0ABX7I8V6_9BACT|nr:tagaturonate reductase [Dyadobacter sandarakinus]QRR02539.1 tagaturonate reductase [Dyadobacter sandarakinus]